jgi:DNA-binding transcriptional MerR regulator
MLQKAGMEDVLNDWTCRKKKNAANITWGEKDPRKAFQLDGGELKAFMATRKRSMSVLTLYKRAKKQKSGLTMEDCQGIIDALGWSADKELPKLAKEYGATIKNLIRYLRRQAGGERTFDTAFRTWKDYMTAAEAMGMRIYREDVKFPKDLWTAHEETTEQNRKRLEKERRRELKRQKAEIAKKDRLSKMAYAQRKKDLEKRYGYAAEGLMIRVPENREEIVAEGKTLQHCVGGYADRHIDGAVTILFLRKEAAPDKPFLTVEMNGDKLVQIHGYKNEGLYTIKGRFAPDPREVYKDFLDPWLDWVAKGSRRNTKGEPVRSRQKVEVQIA